MSIRTSIIASWAAHAVTLLVGLFLVPLVLSRLGEEGYGVWVFVNSLAGYSGILYLGFGPTVCRYVSRHRARGEWDAVNAVVSSVVAVYLTAGLVVMLLAAGFAAAVPSIDRWGSVPIPHVQIAVLILGVNLALGMIGSVYGGVLHAAQRFDLFSAVQGLVALVRLGLTVVCLRQDNGLLVLAGIFLAVTVVENGLTAWLAHREVPTLSLRRTWVTRGVLKECFGFSAFTALRWVSVRMIYMTDTVVIGFVLGPKAIVPYYVGSRLVQMIHQPLEKIGDVVLPSAGACHARNDRTELQRLLARGMQLTLLLAGSVWIGAAYFGGRLLTTWMGPDQTWPVSTTVLLILLGAQLVAQPMMVVRQVLTAVGRVRLQALLDLFQAAVNLGLSLVLIRWMGIVGVAWGTLIPMLLIDLGLLLPYSLRALQIPAAPLLRRVVGPVCLPLALLWAYCEIVSQLHVPAGWPAILAITAGGGLVVAASAYALEWLERHAQPEHRSADRVTVEVTT